MGLAMFWNSQKGFTLIELTLAICIMTVLASVAYPKIANSIRTAQEARTKGNLHVLKMAIAVYYTNHEGAYPTDNLTSLVVENALARIPLKYTPPYHPEGNSVSAGPKSAQSASRGDWFYINDHNDPDFGQVMVNCVHQDMRGRIWTAY